MAHLDPPARAKARKELRQLHEELGATTVYVTHDLAEAFLLADRVAVMQEGHFVQIRSYEDSLRQAFSS